MNWLLDKVPEDFKVIGSSVSLVWAVQAVPKGNMPWISQAKWYPGPLRPGLGETKGVTRAMSSIPPNTWRHQGGLSSHSTTDFQQGGGGGTMVLVTEAKFCKIKEAERRNHTAQMIVRVFLKGDWKIPTSALRKMGKEERILRNTQNVMRVPAENWWSVPAVPQAFTRQTLPVTSIKSDFPPSPLFLGGERDQEAENTCYSTGQKRTSFLLSLPSLDMTYSKTAQN